MRRSNLVEAIDPPRQAGDHARDHRWAHVSGALTLGFGLVLLFGGFDLGVSNAEAGPEPALAEAGVERLRVEVIAVYPHDSQAFTQGLLWHEGQLFESTGGYGSSTLRRVEIEDGRVLQRVPLPRDLFGEGLARVEDRLIQLTWQQGIAAVWDLERFEILDELAFGGEGWGLCFDGEHLVMSDGTDHLFFREPDSLAEDRRIQVTLEGRPLHRLNELECVGDAIWANVWTQETLVRIDPETGRVTAVVEASGLLDEADSKGADVLNGIAYRQDKDTFLVTGKLWPKLFEVKFVPIP